MTFYIENVSAKKRLLNRFETYEEASDFKTKVEEWREYSLKPMMIYQVRKEGENRAESRARYRAENKKKINKYNAEYREKNRKKTRATNAEYYQKNKAKLLEKQSEYYMENKDKIKNYLEVGVGHVGLEAQGLGHVHGLQEIEHVLPTMQTGPADLALSSQAFTVIRGDLGGFTEGFGYLLGVRQGIFTPLGHAEFCGVNPNHAVLTHTVLVEHAGDATAHAHRIEKLLTGLGIAHG